MLPSFTESELLALRTMALALGGFGSIVLLASVLFSLRGKPTRNLWVRYFAFFIILPVIIVPLALNSIFYICMIASLSIGGFFEFARATRLINDKKFFYGCVSAIVAIYGPVFIDWYGLFEAMPAFSTILILFIPILRDRYEDATAKISLSFVGVIYFGWFLSHLAYLRHLSHGINYIVFFLLVVIGNDAFAFLIGNVIGKRGLRPQLSPNKTVEGAIGSWLAVSLLAYLTRPFLVPNFSTLHAIIIAAIMSVGGLTGDLVISVIKRDMRIKDTGHVIPGHGGLLDRLDSILFTAPLYFHYVRYFLEPDRISL